MDKNDLVLSNSSTLNDMWRDDWRIMGQEGYLLGKHLEHRRFRIELCHEDFTQCEFCWDTFNMVDGVSSRAYFSPEEKVWICEKCFTDFCKYFQWTVQEVD